jgi:hypothetical protein
VLGAAMRETDPSICHPAGCPKNDRSRSCCFERRKYVYNEHHMSSCSRSQALVLYRHGCGLDDGCAGGSPSSALAS